MINTIIFDFADTLAELQPSRADIILTLLEKNTNIKISKQSILQGYKYLDLLMPYSSVRIQDKEAKKAFYQQYNQRLLESLGVAHLLKPSQVFEAFTETETHWKLKMGIKELLHDIKEYDIKIGIISNFDSHLNEVIHTKLKISDKVDYLHVSQQVGYEKPDIRFYQSFFCQYDCKIEDSFYIGDSYSLDYVPACEIGLKAVLLDETGLYSHLPDAIASWSEFKCIDGMVKL